MDNRFKCINAIINKLEGRRKDELERIIHKCIENNDYIRLIINIEIDLLIDSLPPNYLENKFKQIDIDSCLRESDLIYSLIKECGHDFCISNFENNSSGDYITYLTDEEFINFLAPKQLKITKHKLKKNSKFWVARLNKLGLSKFRGPFKNKGEGQSRIPWVTKESLVLKDYGKSYIKTLSLGEYVNDKLGLGCGSSSKDSVNFISIKYPTTLEIPLKKPTFIDGSLYGFPGRFVNSSPYLKFHGRTVCTNGSKDGLPEAVHDPLPALTNDFVFSFVGASRAIIDDINITKTALLRFKTAIKYHE